MDFPKVTPTPVAVSLQKIADGLEEKLRTRNDKPCDTIWSPEAEILVIEESKGFLERYNRLADWIAMGPDKKTKADPKRLNEYRLEATREAIRRGGTDTVQLIVFDGDVTDQDYWKATSESLFIMPTHSLRREGEPI